MNQLVHDLNNYAPKMETIPVHVPENDISMEEAPNDISIEDTEVSIENYPQLVPLMVRFAENAHFHWQTEQNHLDDLNEEATRNMDALLHPQLQQNLHDPFIQVEDNIPKMLTFSNGEIFFTNGRLIQSIENDVPKSSVTREKRNTRTCQENRVSQDWLLSFEIGVVEGTGEDIQLLEIFCSSPIMAEENHTFQHNI